MSRSANLKDEISKLMYGSGDVGNPAPDTGTLFLNLIPVDLMEDLLTEELISLARDITRHNCNSKFKPADILFALRDDAKKHARSLELLRMEKELKNVRKTGDKAEADFE
jgi:hypothetical protein